MAKENKNEVRLVTVTEITGRNLVVSAKGKEGIALTIPENVVLPVGIAAGKKYQTEYNKDSGVILSMIERIDYDVKEADLLEGHKTGFAGWPIDKLTQTVPVFEKFMLAEMSKSLKGKSKFDLSDLAGMKSSLDNAIKSLSIPVGFVVVEKPEPNGDIFQFINGSWYSAPSEYYNVSKRRGVDLPGAESEEEEAVNE